MIDGSSIGGDACARTTRPTAAGTFACELHRSQFLRVCGNGDRTLTVHRTRTPIDGFATEAHLLGRLLSLALASHRRLVVASDWISHYAPCHGASCSSSCAHTLGCIWRTVTGCITNASTADRHGDRLGELSQTSAGYGIAEVASNSKYFSTKLYGSMKDVSLDMYAPAAAAAQPSAGPADVVAQWERLRGRFWVRGMLQSFLWRPTADVQARVNAHPAMDVLREIGDAPFIAFHIRLTDNDRDFLSGFGRNGSVTRSFERYMAFADAIRSRHSRRALHHIFVATDSVLAYYEAKQSRWRNAGWVVHANPSVPRATTAAKRNWFRSSRSRELENVMVDVEALRRASFLVGSFQSNIYRLGAELNTAYHETNLTSMPEQAERQRGFAAQLNPLQRIFTVDVEWYEDP